MSFSALLWLALAASPCRLPAEVDGLTVHQYCAFPNEVRVFVRERALCDHWRGEYLDPPQDAKNKGDAKIYKARLREVKAGAKRYCTGSENRLQRLKQLYAKRPDIMQQLRTYEADIN